MKKWMKISQSQINLYRQCPYAYKLRYIKKKEPIMFDPSIVEVGSRVHDAIDKYYRTSYSTEVDEEGILAKSYEILTNDWDHTLPADFLKKAYVCLQHFAEFEVNNLNKGLLMKPLTELRIKADGLYGIIDYYHPETNKVIDFKTNTKAGVGYANKMQAYMYKLLIKHKFNIDINYFTLQFLFPGEIRVVKFDNKMDKIKKDLIMNVEKIKESWRRDLFPKDPRTKSTCNGCSYRFYCGGGEYERKV